MFIFALHNNNHSPNDFYKFSWEGRTNIEDIHEIYIKSIQIWHSAPLGMQYTQL